MLFSDVLGGGLGSSSPRLWRGEANRVIGFKEGGALEFEKEEEATEVQEQLLSGASTDSITVEELQNNPRQERTEFQELEGD
ncbi:hypothetical protein M758_UG054100 [Ceratodon purpureus]|nr:hypothetical protein M758_UG054100 [Ceratodon purpureus]